MIAPLSRLRGSGRLAVLVLCCWAGTGQNALAGTDDGRLEATDFTVIDGDNGEGFARCGSRERAVGGGLLNREDTADAFTSASGPLDASGFTVETGDGDVPKQWYAASVNGGNGEPGRHRVYAVCAPASRARIEATDLRLDHLERGGALAACGPGTRAVGGGVVQSGEADGLVVKASGPTDASGQVTATNTGDVPKQWFGSVANFSGADDRLFRIYAICAPDSRARIEAASFMIGLSGGKAVRCGRDRRALSGGLLPEASPDPLLLAQTGPLAAGGTVSDTATGDVAKRWLVEGINQGIDDTPVRAVAVCA
jgi:hypothetical protein